MGSFFAGWYPGKKIVWGMAAYNLRGIEDGHFYSCKCRIAIAKERCQNTLRRGAQNEASFGGKCVLPPIVFLCLSILLPNKNEKT